MLIKPDLIHFGLARLFLQSFFVLHVLGQDSDLTPREQLNLAYPTIGKPARKLKKCVWERGICGEIPGWPSSSGWGGVVRILAACGLLCENGGTPQTPAAFMCLRNCTEHTAAKKRSEWWLQCVAFTGGLDADAQLET